ncbi:MULTISPECIES: type II toxin-antitoxin system VapC family toxin [unclassified Nodularia (in: cyanobacteria)]|uniref:type II toxin-antitoxin system VapC family toxin n=1 Tax=unclassified Nodularia (in: cyanobacteria) TaxID=2656917 RepID=UPI0018827E62|nr:MULTISPECIES: type II toxin-antitoxin system VapC family toxin [unclassified Nodularia (in: cyanobacteria)]MBE9200207.1 type II toxin-antitoxin system VapC family toxin [Nodularia sp. LEGE 06071]MCC2694248.1 type II toxin-antitoxin system VapC family toxin [Nodularia sp. LEGE 04288]
MKEILVDSNIILDIVTEDANWFDWSSEKLIEYAENTQLNINPIIYAEISMGFQKIEELEAILPLNFFHRLDLPWEAAFLAGKCFMQYRQKGGTKRSPLPDFYIGAHAAIADMMLLTRDVNRYRTYFPTLELIAPEY